MALTLRATFRFLLSSRTGAGFALATGLLVGSSVAADSHACPELTRTKYPFLSCQANAYGGVTLGMTGYEAPAECELRKPDGQCAASPEAWKLPPVLLPHIGT